MSNPSSPENNVDPAGSTQMFRAFVHEQSPRAAAASTSGGGRTGVVVGVAAVIVVLAVVAWLAFM
jgi:hypothetical protein